VLGRYTDVFRGIAHADPQRTAIITRDRTLTYGEFTAEAAALATHLEGEGVRPGDSVAIFSYNRDEFLVAIYGCMAAGLSPVPVNFRYRAAELRQLLDNSRARALIYPRSLSDVVGEALTGLAAGAAPVLVEIDDAHGEPRAGAAPFAQVTSRPGSLPDAPPAGGELRLYTGGTTGQPRGVQWESDYLLEGKLFSIYTLAGVDPPETVDGAVAVAMDPATPRVVTLPLAPFIHGTALFTSLNTLVLGGSIVIHASPRFDASEALRLISTYEVSRLVVAGDAVALPLVEAAEKEDVELTSVTSVMSSGMRLGDEAKRRLHERGELSIVDLLAATEGGPFATAITTSSADLPARLRLMPDAAVLDESGAEIQGRVGALGLLAYRGPLPRGYLGDAEKTRETFRDIGGRRYVVPGDWARVLDDEGHIELLGRGSAVVNTGGEKVYPAEVEQAILEHPAIADAVVVGTPDARFGEAVTAIVVPREGVSIDRAALAAHLDARLAGYKKPRHLIVRESLERSPHGKLDLRRLREEAARELSEVTQ